MLIPSDKHIKGLVRIVVETLVEISRFQQNNTLLWLENLLKQYIRDQIKAKKLSISRLERLSGFTGLRQYLETPGRSASVKNVLAVLSVLNTI